MKSIFNFSAFGYYDWSLTDLANTINLSSPGLIQAGYPIIGLSDSIGSAVIERSIFSTF